MTGARLHRVAKYLTSDELMLTYDDGLSDVDVPALVKFHRAHGKIATITGVRPPGRFGELVVDGNRVKTFAEKPTEGDHGVINGGFFLFRREMLRYVSNDDSCTLERDPLENVARDA